MFKTKNIFIKSYIKIFVLFIFISIAGFIKMNNVYGVETGSDGTGQFTGGAGCGDEYNRCATVEHEGYFFTIVKNYRKTQNGISYTRVSNTVLDSTIGYQYNFNGLLYDIKRGKDTFDRIINETIGLRRKTEFYDNNYYILIQPNIGFHYATKSGIYYNTGLGNSYDVARRLRDAKTQRNDIFETVLTRNLVCMTYVDWPGADEVCTSDPVASRESEYINLAINNSRYGNAVVWAKEVNFTLNILKIDLSGKLITSDTAIFDLYPNDDCSGTPLTGLVILGEGSFSYPPGTYSIREVEAPNGYDKDPTCYKQNFKGGTGYTIKVVNTRSKGNIKITKTDTYGNKITSGKAKFYMYKNYNCSGNPFRIVDVLGSTTVSSLETGTYSIKEVTAPDGYELNSYCRSVSVMADTTNNVTIRNTRSRGNLEIIKIDKSTKAQISSSTATFAIYDNNNCTGNPMRTFSIKGKGSISLETGNYSFKEIVAPKDYYLVSTCHSAPITRNNTTSKTIENEKKYGFLKINKLDEDTGKKIVGNSKLAKFNIYKGTNCTGTPFREVTVSNADDDKIQLNIGNYAIKEKEAPGGYITDTQTCKTVVINDKEISSIDFTNVKGCKLAFDSLSDKTSPIDRIKLYEKYSFVNLLKFDIDNSEEACRNDLVSKNTINMGCLSCQNTSIKFDQGNLSEYNDLEKVPISTVGGEKTAYCNVVFDLKNNLRNNGGQLYEYVSSYRFKPNNLDNAFKAGQMVLNRDELNKDIAQGTLTKTCYVYDADLTSVNTALESRGKLIYDNYIKSISLNNSILNSIQKEGKWETVEGRYNNSKYVKFTKTITATYNLNARYSEFGSGDTNNCEVESSKCRLLGYGFETKLNTKDGDYHVPFKIKIDSKNLGLSSNVNEYSSDKCNYSIKSEVITPDPDPELNIEFRSIDTNNPFPGRSGSGRKVGTNWCDNNDCLGTNQLIKNIMNRTNSYNKKGNLVGNGPIYTIRLTPTIMESIRKYNSKTTYDDYLECDVVSCKSKFLQTYGIFKNK